MAPCGASVCTGVNQHRRDPHRILSESFCFRWLIRSKGGVPIGADRDPTRLLICAGGPRAYVQRYRGSASVLMHSHGRPLRGAAQVSQRLAASANASDLAINVRILLIKDMLGDGGRCRKIGSPRLAVAYRRRPGSGCRFVSGHRWTERRR